MGRVGKGGKVLVSYSKSAQLGKIVNPRKKKRDGTPLPRVEESKRAVATLKEIYSDQGITSCEYVDKKGCPCKSRLALSFAHDDNRKNLEPGDIDSFEKTLLLCQKHHAQIENDEAETERLFSKLRKG